MPFFDGTGPRGLGPMTGRGMGPCGGYFGYGRGGSGWFGRGRGRGFGFGRGWNWGNGPGFFGRSGTLTKEEEKKLLEDYKKDLEAELTAVEKDLKDLG